jgi:hypothetical protein
MPMSANKVSCRATPSCILFVATLVLMLAPAIRLSGQTAANVPDITGSWERARDASIPAASQPPLKPQYLKEYQAKLQAFREANQKGEPIADHVVMCLPDGMPGMMSGPFPMEVLQSKGQVTIIQEAYTQVRRILLDREQMKIDDVEPGFYGRSVGRWDSGTLVVDTVGIKEGVLYQNVPHSKDVRIKERISLGANGLLRDEITIEDPVVLEKPWTFTFGYRRMNDYQLLEYICEDNREYADQNGIQRIRVEPARDKR